MALAQHKAPEEPAPADGATPAASARGGTMALLRPAVAILGVVLAVVLVWLSFREVGLAAVLDAVGRVQPGTALLGTAIYAGALAVRGLRWHMLLNRAGVLTRRIAMEGLLVGFATNFALPGRLGELYRADYMNARSSISRTTVLGTIFVERAFDGLVLAGLLVLAAASLSVGSGGGIPMQFIITAVVLFTVASAVALWLRRLDKLPIPVPLLGALFERFKSGLRTVDRTNFVAFLGFTLIIWALEISALAMLLIALGLSPTMLGLTLIQSVSSLSTLLPTAPAFIGSYQFAFVISFDAIGWPKASALAASILVQLALFVPTMAVGFALAMRAYVGDMAGRGRSAP